MIENERMSFSNMAWSNTYLIAVDIINNRSFTRHLDLLTEVVTGYTIRFLALEKTLTDFFA